MSYINHNGSIKKESEVSIYPDNRGFRYADGLFETIRVQDGKILLKELHLERLYSSLEKMKFDLTNFPSPNKLVEQIIEITQANVHQHSARIRLTVFAGDGLLSHPFPRIPNYIIQSSPVNAFVFDNQGLKVDFCPGVVKPADNYSPIKSNNFLPYVMASLWAKENNLDDAILLNPYNNVADATIANLFIVTDGLIKTPPLDDGCVDGVMRRYLLRCFKKDNIIHLETSITKDDVLQTAEVFLTNVIIGIKPITKVGNSNYTIEKSKLLFNQYILPLSV